jgi:AraC-like DNA-binding protein
MASALILPAGTAPLGDPGRLASDDRALAAFERAAAACEDPLLPPSLREHAVAEVLLWLAEEGVGLAPARAPGLSARLRSLLAEDPAAPWTAPEAARALAVSEATLRRRLARDGTSFSDLLADLRMTRALGLLQATSHPVNRVALEVGYECPSRFAARFRARFGIAPSMVRGRTERIGTEADRRGTAAKPAPR